MKIEFRTPDRSLSTFCFARGEKIPVPFHGSCFAFQSGGQTREGGRERDSRTADFWKSFNARQKKSQTVAERRLIVRVARDDKLVRASASHDREKRNRQYLFVRAIVTSRDEGEKGEGITD
jgi:hypothetical protein